MLLSRNYWTSNLAEIEKHSRNYLVIKNEHFHEFKDVDNFEKGIDVVEFITYVSLFNDYFQSEGINKKFDLSILYKVIECIYSGKQLDAVQLAQYFKLTQDVETFVSNLSRISNIQDFAVMNSDIEFVLFGLSPDQLKEIQMNGLNECDGLCDTYLDLKCNYLRSNLDYSTFHSNVEKLISKTLLENENIKSLKHIKDKENRNIIKDLKKHNLLDYQSEIEIKKELQLQD